MISPQAHAGARFLSCDWGTTAFRLRLVARDSLEILAESSSEEGIAGVFRDWKENHRKTRSRWDFFLDVIRRHLGMLEARVGHPLDGTPLLLSGMASASIGLCELPYKKLPFAGDGSDLTVELRRASGEFPFDVLVISGASTDDDVMRGEETQLVGALRGTDETGERSVWVFPGTHSKHVTVESGSAIGFVSYMTGEFFELLARKSILAQSVERVGDLEQPEHRAAFEEGVRAGADRNLLHAAFMVRTRALLRGVAPGPGYHYLSGLLIGDELADLARSDDGITLIGQGALLSCYHEAFRVLGRSKLVHSLDVDDCLIRGQISVARRHGLIP